MEKSGNSDFWREKFAALQQMNMKSSGRGALLPQNVQAEADAFSFRHGGVRCVVTQNTSSADWEILFSPELKIRLFVQNQTKGSILQKNGAGFIKLGDAKFFSNPVPELDYFAEHFDSFCVEYEEAAGLAARLEKMQALTAEFIKALLMKKLDGAKSRWTLLPSGENFTLITELNGVKTEHFISSGSFYADVEALCVE